MTMFERFTRDARVSIVLAQEEARDLGTREIRPEHLLVGVLQGAGHDLAALLGGYGLTAEAVRAQLAIARPDDDALDADADALKSIGIDLRAVRDAVTSTFGDDAFDNALRKSGRRSRRRGHVPFTRAAKKALELALREALAHKDNEIGCGHILLGILRGGDRVAIGLITEHVAAAHLRAAVIALMDKAA
jgi:ATP-dependent Clp protease ATP-binding subunit ClpA